MQAFFVVAIRPIVATGTLHLRFFWYRRKDRFEQRRPLHLSILFSTNFCKDSAKNYSRAYNIITMLDVQFSSRRRAFFRAWTSPAVRDEESPVELFDTELTSSIWTCSTCLYRFRNVLHCDAAIVVDKHTGNECWQSHSADVGSHKILRSFRS
jgi:hypothetical protein